MRMKEERRKEMKRCGREYLKEKGRWWGEEKNRRGVGWRLGARTSRLLAGAGLIGSVTCVGGALSSPQRRRRTFVFFLYLMYVRKYHEGMEDL